VKPVKAIAFNDPSPAQASSYARLGPKYPDRLIAFFASRLSPQESAQRLDRLWDRIRRANPADCRLTLGGGRQPKNLEEDGA